MAKQQTVLVTGAARGIGKGIARRFAAAGFQVAVNDLDPEAAQAACDELASTYDATCLAAAADVSDPDAVQSMIAQVEDQLGPVDVLVNNAGIIGMVPFQDMTYEQWRRMFAVHVDGTFNCSKAVVTGMLQRGRGSILNISSNWGQRGGAGAVHYSAAKAAIIGFTKALARELAGEGIRVNSVAPGPIETPMIETEAEMKGTSVESVREELSAGVPLGRLGTIQEVAEAVFFVASDSGSFFTGQVVAPNGGEVI